MAEEFFQEQLASSNVDLHEIVGRAKSLDSARAKILQRRYGDPYRQLTDQIGVRVIAFFEPDVDRLVASLRPLMDVDDSRSPDKRRELGLREFGYKSVHLVGRIREGYLSMRFHRLVGVRVEVQVRSILEHAWAEIEHEIVYKSGIRFPKGIIRRFSSLAGTLEVLEREFEALRLQRNQLISTFAEQARAGRGLDESLDAAQLLGFLEVFRSGGLSWRQGVQAGTPFPPRIESACVAALRETGISTGRDLQQSLRTRSFVRVLSRYAAIEGRATASELSHLAVVVLVVAARDMEVARQYLPDLAANPAVERAIAPRSNG